MGEELTASMLGEVPPENLVGLVSIRGSGHSHVAILARSMGIPTVMGAVDLPFTQLEDREIILDGYNGHVYFNPSAELYGRFQAIYEEEQQLSKGLEALKDLPCITTDDYRMPLLVNTGLQADIARSLDRGAEGVGLYRTEVPFLLRERFPSEEEQRQIYREQLEAFMPMPVTMRTLDIGGDKPMGLSSRCTGRNPALGLRGIRRHLVEHPDELRTQLRAILRAAAGAPVGILIPMVTTVEDLVRTKRHWESVREELGEKGEPFSTDVVLGAMIETPAAAAAVGEILSQVAFISLGTNDLLQYFMAADRDNESVIDYQDATHPAFLWLMRHIIEQARKAGREADVTVCGEVASDARVFPHLVRMGYRSFSVSPVSAASFRSTCAGLSLNDGVKEEQP